MASSMILFLRALDLDASAMILGSRLCLRMARMNSCFVERETAVALPARRAVSARG